VVDGKEKLPDTSPDDALAHAETLGTEGSGGSAGAAERDSMRSPGDPETIGRFTIIERLGSGAMGAVYRAHDPTLRRDVALKLLHVHRKRTGRERFDREARALAKLNHPNVLTVHEVGTVGKDLFIATELVEGQTLGSWLREEKRSWREIVAVFVAAGRGLAAAHAAGIVHRDFKPENVMIGQDGRARVVDFGLARMVAEPERVGAGGTDSSLSQPRLTQAGSLLGTPIYMAPEQLRGQEADARSDQFGFCVALHEALCGCRPFGANSVSALLAAIARGPASPPPGCDAPTALLEVVARGLAAAPKARHASMDVLVALLARDPVAARRGRLVAAGVAVAMAALVGVVAITWLRGGTRASATCRDADRLAAGVWDAETQDAVRSAFAASERAYAADVFTRVRDRIDGYLEGWVAMRVDACEATRVRREQSESLMDLRMRWLDRRLDELGALVMVLEKADVGVLDRATKAVSELTPIRACADANALESAIPPPTDPAQRAVVEELTKEIARAEALRRAGKYDEALEIAAAAAARARTVDYAPIRARAFFTLGNIQDWLGKGQEAETSLNAAIEEAAFAHDDGLEADSMIMLLYVVGATEGRPEEAEQLFAPARVAAARVSHDEYRQAGLANNIGSILATAGRPAEARPELERALALYEAARGPDDLKVADALGNLGIVAADLGDFEGALAYHQRSLRITEAALGPDHPDVAAALNGLSNKLAVLGREAEAVESAQRALRILEAALAPDNPDIAMAHITLANAYSHQPELSMEHLRRAFDVMKRAYDSDHPRQGIAHTNLADILRAQGNCAEASPHYERALAVFTATLGTEHPMLAYPLMGRGACLFDGGDVAGAKRAQTEAMRLIEGTAADPVLVAELSFGLARTLWAEGRERKRAVELARAARAIWAGGAEGAEEKLPILDDWLAKHAD